MSTDLDRALAVLCLEYKLLSPERAVILMNTHGDNTRRLGEAIRAEVAEGPLLSAIARELGLEYVDLYGARTGLTSDTELLARADRNLLRSFSAIPLIDEAGKVVVATVNPSDLDLRAYMEERYPDMKLVLASRGQIQSKLALAGSPLVEALPGAEVDAPRATPVATAPQPRNPLVAWVESTLETAVAEGASDIHFEINIDGTLLVRFRIDGILRAIPAQVRGRENEVIGILMNRADMDQANLREPQDGSFSFVASARKIDVRAAMLPQINGPSVVLRLLDSVNVQRRLSDMGFAPEQLTALERTANSSQGTVIVCGPTGSGKTTTLYALIREVASVEKNVITIEDPVEYRMNLVNQTAVLHGSERDLDFDKILRATLRMDPDVILVGEIRDAITARTAMDAAITGHLVFSTVHARDTVGIYTRLSEMGVPSYLVAEAMSLGVSQRLVRRLHDCARLGPATARDQQMFQVVGASAPEQLLQPVGCTGCAMTGYRGRIAVVEVLDPSAAFRQKVLANAGREELVDQARADGMIPMLDDGMRLVRDQLTTIEEVIRSVAAG